MKIVKNIKSIIIVLAITVFMLVAYLISSNFFEPKVYNIMVNAFSANKYASKDVVLVVIDDESVKQIRWPWKRELYGQIFEYLDKYTKCKAVGFDAIITTPDKDNPQSDSKFFNSVKNTDNLIVGFAPLRTPYIDQEEGLAYNKKFKDKFAINIIDKRTQKPSSNLLSLSEFPTQYFNSVKKVGSVDTPVDGIDNYLRRIPQMIDYHGTLYPSLALRIYSYLTNNSKYYVYNNQIKSDKTNLKIPIYSSGGGIYNNLHFYKMFPSKEKGVDSLYAHKTYSAITLINSLNNMKAGKKPLIHPSEFEDKIVMVGAYAKATAIGLEDEKQTPMSSAQSGVDIQATNLDNLLNNEFIAQSTTTQDVISILILLILTFIIIRYFSLFVSLGIIALIMVSYIAICIICYMNNFAVSVITPLMLMIITMTMSYSYRFILEGRNKEKIKNAMGKYISQDIMQHVVSNIDGIKLGGKRANVTVLFADIRGFTSMSEKMSAEEVSVILNDYFTEIEPIISKYNGVINKFIGDAVMAIFGEPIQDKSHAENAVKCADEMLKKVESLQQKWMAEGKPKLEIGVGINTGDAFVGNIGSEKRLEYTVIGDMVNLASRIESYNKVYKTRFLISATTYEKVRNLVDVIKISEVVIRGKAKKLDIYEVLRLVN